MSRLLRRLTVGAALTLWGRGRFSVEVDCNYTPAFSSSALGHGPAIPLANGNSMVESQAELVTNLPMVTAGGIAAPWIRTRSGRLRPYVSFGAGVLRSTARAMTRAGLKVQGTRSFGIVEGGGGLLWLFTPPRGCSRRRALPDGLDGTREHCQRLDVRPRHHRRYAGVLTAAAPTSACPMLRPSSTDRTRVRSVMAAVASRPLRSAGVSASTCSTVLRRTSSATVRTGRV